jgi:hypothetical protein
MAMSGQNPMPMNQPYNSSGAYGPGSTSGMTPSGGATTSSAGYGSGQSGWSQTPARPTTTYSPGTYSPGGYTTTTPTTTTTSGPTPEISNTSPATSAPTMTSTSGPAITNGVTPVSYRPPVGGTADRVPPPGGSAAGFSSTPQFSTSPGSSMTISASDPTGAGRTATPPVVDSAPPAGGTSSTVYSVPGSVGGVPGKTE